MAQSKPRKPSIDNVSIEEDGTSLSLTWSDQSRAHFHAVWLRANCQGPTSVDPGNGQRKDSILDVPEDSRLRAAQISNDGRLVVVFEPDEFQCDFDAAWLRVNQYDRMPELPSGWVAENRTTWDGRLEVPSPDYAETFASDTSLDHWLGQLIKYGVARLSGCPTNKDAIVDITDRFSFVRETNYGKTFDVESVANPINLAFSNQGLRVHTDNPYRNPVPGLQLLLCLETSGEGGESIVVDGFRAAEFLRSNDPGSFRLLSQHAVSFQFSSPGTELMASAPVIQLSTQGEIIQIRYNDRSIAPVRLPFGITPDWYRAYRTFAALLADSEHEIRFQLTSGDLFVVDNHRVLHGRTAFTLDNGKRLLQGCYAEKDSVLSRLAVAKSTRH